MHNFFINFSTDQNSFSWRIWSFVPNSHTSAFKDNFLFAIATKTVVTILSNIFALASTIEFTLVAEEEVVVHQMNQVSLLLKSHTHLTSDQWKRTVNFIKKNMAGISTDSWWSGLS